MIARGLDPRIVPEQLSVVAQPVFEKSGALWRAHYLEFLTRGPLGTNLEAAGVLFEYARRKNQEGALDRVCIQRALERARLLPLDVRLAVNVHASTLEGDRDFPRFLAETPGISPERVILEIVEHAPAWSGDAFKRALESLRELGVRFAMDDIGTGQASYRMILDCHPDYLKVDRYIVLGCSTDPRRRAVLESLVTLGARLGSRVVAEGIETRADLEAVEALGIELVQGFLLAEPRPFDDLESLLDANPI